MSQQHPNNGSSAPCYLDHIAKLQLSKKHDCESTTYNRPRKGGNSDRSESNERIGRRLRYQRGSNNLSAGATTQQRSVFEKNRDSSQPEFENRYQRNKAFLDFTLQQGVTLSCLAGYIRGGCSEGHSYLKSVFCGREYCPNCGEDGSLIHQRKIARWMPKVMQMDKMAYLVLTIPSELMHHYRDVENLRKFRLSVKNKLLKMGYTRGLMRWHWFGDCPSCDGNGCDVCNTTGASEVYKPHLNIFIEEGFLPKDEFAAFTYQLKKWMAAHWYREFKYRVEDIEKLNCHYQYCATTNIRVHHLKYVTRATFRRFNPSHAKRSKGFRFSQAWGKWDNAEGETKDALVTIEAGCCPDCKTETGLINKIDWKNGGKYNEHVFDEGQYVKTDPDSEKRKHVSRLIKRRELQLDGKQMQHVSGGYYRLIDADLNDYTPKNHNMANVVEIERKQLQLMAELRLKQKQYFRTRSNYLLVECKKLEQQLDNFLTKQVEAGNIVDPAKRRGESGNLFTNA